MSWLPPFCLPPRNSLSACLAESVSAALQTRPGCFLERAQLLAGCTDSGVCSLRGCLLLRLLFPGASDNGPGCGADRRAFAGVTRCSANERSSRCTFRGSNDRRALGGVGGLFLRRGRRRRRIDRGRRQRVESGLALCRFEAFPAIDFLLIHSLSLRRVSDETH